MKSTIKLNLGEIHQSILFDIEKKFYNETLSKSDNEAIFEKNIFGRIFTITVFYYLNDVHVFKVNEMSVKDSYNNDCKVEVFNKNYNPSQKSFHIIVSEFIDNLENERSINNINAEYIEETESILNIINR